MGHGTVGIVLTSAFFDEVFTVSLLVTIDVVNLLDEIVGKRTMLVVAFAFTRTEVLLVIHLAKRASPFGGEVIIEAFLGVVRMVGGASLGFEKREIQMQEDRIFDFLELRRHLIQIIT